MKKAPAGDPLLTPPKHLSDRMRSWVSSILGRYLIEPEDFLLLVLIAETWDGGERARIIVAKKGATFLDRFGAPRNRPEISQLRDARLVIARLMKQLGLGDEEAPASSTKTRPRVAPSLMRKEG
jgi:phage terminase small subunit